MNPSISRLAIIVALLMVLPTAVLSILAGRGFRNWEALLQGRFEAGAARAVRDVSVRLSADLESDWRTVRAAVAGALAPRGRLRDIETAAFGLAHKTPLAGRVMVFMDPLGFVYPETADRAMEEMAREWRQALAGAAGALTVDRPLLLPAAGGALDCFGPLGQGPGLYVGYRVNAAGFTQRLNEILAEVAGDDLVLSVAAAAGAEQLPVLVSDPFAPAPDRLPDGGRQTQNEGPLFTASLRAPLDFMTMTVAWRDPGQAARAAAWQSRLYVWGLALLVLCVVCGGWLILRQTAVELRLLRERSDRVMAVSHDLRTPIAAMKVMAESLYLDHVRDPEKRREFLRMLIAESDRLSDIAERVLFFVRQERRAVVHAPEWLDAGQLALAAVTVYRERAALRDPDAAATIEFQADENLPPVHVDRRAITAVLMNLIDNALTHGKTAPDHPGGVNAGGSAAVRVSVGALYRRGRRRRRVCLAVRDSGPGIPRREQSRIFRRFYRGSAAQPSGSGLGLALCRDIVRAHGGRLEVRSEPGRGSEFRVLLIAGNGTTS